MRVTEVINEMARADLAGAEEAIKSGDLDKVASHYVKKAKERGLDAKKIVSGLGATFRTFEEITPEQISELKTKVKELVSGEMPPKKEKTKKSKKEEKEEKDEEEDEGEDASVTAAKASTKAKQKTVLIKKKAEEGLGEAYYPTERERILMNAGMLNERTMGPIDSDNRPRYGKKVGGAGQEGDSFGKKKKSMKTANQNIPNNPTKTGKGDQDSLAPKLKSKKLSKRTEPSLDNLSLIDKPREKSLAQKGGFKHKKEGKANIDSFGRKIGRLSGK